MFKTDWDFVENHFLSSTNTKHTLLLYNPKCYCIWPYAFETGCTCVTAVRKSRPMRLKRDLRWRRAESNWRHWRHWRVHRVPTLRSAVLCFETLRSRRYSHRRKQTPRLLACLPVRLRSVYLRLGTLYSIDHLHTNPARSGDALIDLLQSRNLKVYC